jgi:hypothetical protein
MRFARRSPLLLILLAALLAGCGGNQIAADEVPVDPPVLTIPTDADAAPGATTADSNDAEQTDKDADADADADATPTAEPGTGGAATSSGGSGSTGGTAATPAPTAAATATAPPEDTGGATADEGLDQFCADNPGAC